jgi:hypothetical protein
MTMPRFISGRRVAAVAGAAATFWFIAVAS